MRALSHSSIHLYLDCPQKWKLKYIDRLPEKPKHFFSFGKSMHSALEFLYGVATPPPPSLDKVLAYLRDNWISEGFFGAEQEAEYKAEGERILGEYYRKHLESFKVPFFVEYKFDLKVEGVAVTGYVDRVDKTESGGLAIIDYKTGKAFDLDRVREDPQLTMYQMACEELLGMPVESLTFYHLPSQTPLSVPRREESLVKDLRKTIMEVAGRIQGGLAELDKGAAADSIVPQFEPKPEERKCGWCDFKPHCPAWRHAYAAREEAPAAPVAKTEEKLAKLVDRYGKMKDDLREREAKAEELKDQIVAALREKGYVRAFGDGYEVSLHSEEKWDFSDKQKVLDAIQRAGFWDRIISPSAPLVQKLMAASDLPMDLRDRLQRLGQKAVHSVLRVKKVEEEG